ncbi:protein atonal homolog 7 [Eurytemora carolleeae]|uniref:protein atonal homolog 7 n=1 Tax=Eurytemora carolleeae TaxID=1294199 RepID=UPI000C793E7E|nr:protein atonal homolog 7 [Eurytemora carolleeae]|eukprot:XP_023320834.1 protein atonal homolog 7-like [Eurytemora affinis]
MMIFINLSEVVHFTYEYEQDQSDEIYWCSLPLPEEVEHVVYSSGEKKGRRKRGRKHCIYKHIPHSEKPPHVVEKRNARERRRVEAVNSAFVRLRRAVPIENKRGKRVSKVKVLQKAIDYITSLRSMISVHDGVELEESIAMQDVVFAF